MYKNEKIEAIYFGIHDKLSNDTFFPRKWNCFTIFLSAEVMKLLEKQF
jgi:hypothetical protein